MFYLDTHQQKVNFADNDVLEVISNQMKDSASREWVNLADDHTLICYIRIRYAGSLQCLLPS